MMTAQTHKQFSFFIVIFKVLVIGKNAKRGCRDESPVFLSARKVRLDITLQTKCKTEYMKTTKLFQEMSAEERLQWATRFGEFLHTEWPALEVAARAKQVQWSLDLQRRMERMSGGRKMICIIGKPLRSLSYKGQHDAVLTNNTSSERYEGKE